MDKNKKAPPHTPTPWNIDDTGIIWGPKDSDGHPEVTNTYDAGLSDEDAAYIVRAVNVHEELLGTLKWIAQRVGVPFDIRAACNEAIAKAEGK